MREGFSQHFMLQNYDYMLKQKNIFIKESSHVLALEVYMFLQLHCPAGSDNIYARPICLKINK